MTVTLVLERKTQGDETPVFVADDGQPIASMTPRVGDDDYWAYRVGLTEGQALLGFPKFGVVGIGFAVEEDWNTNLPSTCGADEILEHIWHNAGPTVTDKAVVRQAIEMIQQAVEEDRRG